MQPRIHRGIVWVLENAQPRYMRLQLNLVHSQQLAPNVLSGSVHCMVWCIVWCMVRHTVYA